MSRRYYRLNRRITKQVELHQSLQVRGVEMRQLRCEPVPRFKCGAADRRAVPDGAHKILTDEISLTIAFGRAIRDCCAAEHAVRTFSQIGYCDTAYVRIPPLRWPFRIVELRAVAAFRGHYGALNNFRCELWGGMRGWILFASLPIVLGRPVTAMAIDEVNTRRQSRSAPAWTARWRHFHLRRIIEEVFNAELR